MNKRTIRDAIEFIPFLGEFVGSFFCVASSDNFWKAAPFFLAAVGMIPNVCACNTLFCGVGYLVSWCRWLAIIVTY